MFSLRIDEQLEIRLYEDRHAEQLFEMTNADRAHARQWLPWLDDNTTLEHTAGPVRCPRPVRRRQPPRRLLGRWLLRRRPAGERAGPGTTGARAPAPVGGIPRVGTTFGTAHAPDGPARGAPGRVATISLTGGRQRQG